MKLRDQVALVTGAAKGMGRAIVLRLADEGADLVLAAREVPPLEAVAGEVRGRGRKAVVVPTDVRDEASVRAMVEAALDGFGGRIDILVNCAGTTGPIETPVHEIKIEDWDEVLAVNLRGTFLPTKHVVPVMLRQRRGKIVNIAGTSGLRGYKLRAAYSSSKWAVRGCTISTKCRPVLRIHCDSVCSLFMATPLGRFTGAGCLSRCGRDFAALRPISWAAV